MSIEAIERRKEKVFLFYFFSFFSLVGSGAYPPPPPLIPPPFDFDSCGPSLRGNSRDLLKGGNWIRISNQEMGPIFNVMTLWGNYYYSPGYLGIRLPS
jgi:hypothetical protein